MKKTFEAQIEKERLTYIVLPFDPSKEFQKKGKITVEGQINGHKYKKSLLSRGNGKYILTLNKNMLKEFGVNVGDTVSISMELEGQNISNDIKEHEDILEYYKSSKEKRTKNEKLNVFETIFTRRSMRNFTGEVVKDSELETIIKAGCYAPSANNGQPWEFIVIKDKTTLEKIAQIHSYAKMLPQAGCGIIVCGDKEKQSQTGFLIEDCSAAIQNMLLCAHGLGIGSVWCGLYPITKLTKGIKELLELPHNIVPVGLIVLGYTEEEKDIVYRYSDDKVHIEKW